jgi:hypothetical protein
MYPAPRQDMGGSLMADPTSVEDLYETILGRASDAGGLQYWQGLQAGGMSLADISNEFMHSDEYQASHPGGSVEPATVTGQTYGDNRTTLLGKDISDMRWDDLVADIQTDKLQRSQRSDSYDAYSGNAYSALLGTEVQQYVAQGTGRDPQTGFYKKDAGPDPWAASSISSVNIKDTISGREGYMTQLVRGDDGSVRVKEYEEKNGFLRDMITFVAIAASMGAAITAVGGAQAAGAAAAGTTEGAVATGSAVGEGVAAGTAAAETSGGIVASSSATGAGELSLADAITTYAPDFAGEAAAAGMGEAAAVATSVSPEITTALASDFPGVTTSFQPGTLGSGLNGIVSPTTLEGIAGVGEVISPELLGTGLAETLTAVGPIPGLEYTLGGSIMAGAEGTLSTATGVGSAVTNFANTGIGLTPLAENWWDKLVKPVVTDGLGIKDVISGLGALGAITSVINGIGGTPGTNATGPTINFPDIKPKEPSSGPLSLSANQRAGVRFGQTKSKRELKGKFAGTGIKIK